jgi:S1-C subfamily serine protease
MRLPDWLIYILVLGALLWALSHAGEDASPPPPSQDAIREGPGPFLAGPTAFDPEIIVDVGPQATGLGTAFAIDAAGWWLTARHVVDGCREVGIRVGGGRALKAEATVARFADLALLRTTSAPKPLELDLSPEDLRVGQTGYHIGFPQGEPGEAASRLIGWERLIARGRAEWDEPVLAWNELGRTEGLTGSLAGMSGGPVFDANGRVIGVTIAESSRRGRIYTSSPTKIAELLRLNQVNPVGLPGPELSLRQYGQKADDLRRELAVAQVLCVAD